MPNIHLQEIWIYPVKSCRGTRLDRASLGPRGLDGDREWLIVDQQGRFLTQRSLPGLARISPSLSATELRLSHPGQQDLLLPRDPLALGGTAAQVLIWKDSVEAQDAGDEAAQWLEAALRVKARLVRATAGTLREPDTKWRQGLPAPLNFPDGFPLLVCNEASLAELNSRLPSAVPMSRFRANVVISGLPAFAEDEVDTLRCGAVELRLVKPCTRCSIPGVDQQTGEPGVNPLPVLMSYRYDSALSGATFGMNAIIAAGVGQPLVPGPASARFRPANSP